MTNEEAQIIIGNIPIKPEVLDDCYSIAEYQEAKAMAIKALEQEPCEDWCDVPSNEMTLEQARQAVKDLRKKLAEHLDKEPCEDCISRQKALDCFEQTNTRQGAKHAIETLPSVTPQTVTEFADKCKECGKMLNDKLQLCEDAVSRKAVLDLMADYDLSMGQVVRGIHALPSVKPKYTDEEIDKAQAVEQAYVDKMVELAVAEIKRPKGKWMECGGDEPWLKGYCCSLCNFTATNKYNYCPDCGAEMSGGGEDEADN